MGVVKRGVWSFETVEAIVEASEPEVLGKRR
jgi:hypothetical protein